MGQLILVRHGQASFGADDYDVLSDTGWQQGRALGAWLARSGPTPSALVRGGLRRHRETLEAVVAGAGWDGDLPTEVDAAWDEFDHVGLVDSWPDLPEGPLDRRGFQEVYEKVTAAWTAGSFPGDRDGDSADGVESYADFVARVRGGLARASGAAGSGRTVVAVTSGGPIAAVCAALMDPESTADQATTARLWSRFNTVVVNAAITRVVVGSQGARLLTFNEHPHLEGELLTYR